MIDEIRLAACRATNRRQYSQEDARHSKNVGGESYSPGPGFVGEYGIGAHRQEDPAKPFDNCGWNDLRLRES